MFQRAAASFDECSTAGIFLTGLRSQSFQSRLLFHSGIIPLPSSDTPALPSSDPVPVADLKGEFQPFFPCFSWPYPAPSPVISVTALIPLRMLENREFWRFEVPPCSPHPLETGQDLGSVHPRVRIDLGHGTKPCSAFPGLFPTTESPFSLDS